MIEITNFSIFLLKLKPQLNSALILKKAEAINPIILTSYRKDIGQQVS